MTIRTWGWDIAIAHVEKLEAEIAALRVAVKLLIGLRKDIPWKDIEEPTVDDWVALAKKRMENTK